MIIGVLNERTQGVDRFPTGSSRAVGEHQGGESKARNSHQSTVDFHRFVFDSLAERFGILVPGLLAPAKLSSHQLEFARKILDLVEHGRLDIGTRGQKGPTKTSR